MNTYAAVFVFAMIVIFVTLLMTLGLYVVSALAQYRLLRRAGHAYPASAWVPFWNTWTHCRSTGGRPKARHAGSIGSGFCGHPSPDPRRK